MSAIGFAEGAQYILCKPRHSQTLPSPSIISCNMRVTTLLLQLQRPYPLSEEYKSHRSHTYLEWHSVSHLAPMVLYIPLHAPFPRSKVQQAKVLRNDTEFTGQLEGYEGVTAQCHNCMYGCILTTTTTTLYRKVISLGDMRLIRGYEKQVGIGPRTASHDGHSSRFVLLYVLSPFPFPC